MQTTSLRTSSSTGLQMDLFCVLSMPLLVSVFTQTVILNLQSLFLPSVSIVSFLRFCVSLFWRFSPLSSHFSFSIPNPSRPVSTLSWRLGLDGG